MCHYSRCSTTEWNADTGAGRDAGKRETDRNGGIVWRRRDYGYYGARVYERPESEEKSDHDWREYHVRKSGRGIRQNEARNNPG